MNALVFLRGHIDYIRLLVLVLALASSCGWLRLVCFSIEQGTRDGTHQASYPIIPRKGRQALPWRAGPGATPFFGVTLEKGGPWALYPQPPPPTPSGKARLSQIDGAPFFCHDLRRSTGASCGGGWGPQPPVGAGGSISRIPSLVISLASSAITQRQGTSWTLCHRIRFLIIGSPFAIAGHGAARAQAS